MFNAYIFSKYDQQNDKKQREEEKEEEKGEDTFTFNYTPLPVGENKSDDVEWINYNSDKLTKDKKVALAFDATSEFLTSFENQIGELLLSQKEENKLFELCGKLLDHMQELNSALIHSSDRMNASQVREQS